MAQIIKTISVSKEEDVFMTENKVSPTRIIRNKLQEMMEFAKNGEQNAELLRKLNNWKETTEKYRDFLEKKGLIDEFLEI